ncbi:hypothetical protein BKA65DRAFT_521001 [Rhexocercosporidium sp. MPI-PUGE-AT-0058]|nr:hypothetical protein BKA65DRAFT_521001 [Rhexocercosporidium sp. MPI-PUGE-AT-0058]
MLFPASINSLTTLLLLLATPLLAVPTSNPSSTTTLNTNPSHGLIARQCLAVPLKCDNTAIMYRDGNVFIADCRWSNLRCVENGFEGLGAKCQR